MTATMHRKPKARYAKKATTDVAQVVTDLMLEKLHEGVVPWQKPWKSLSDAPRSLTTGKLYRGINIFLLQLTTLSKGYTSPLWGTYKQISERGGQVRRKEESTEIVFWKLLVKESTDSDGKPTTKRIPFLNTYRVFNADQADWPEGSKLPVQAVRNNDERDTDCDALVAEYLATGPSLVHGGSRAFYRPGTDTVTVPAFADFDSAEHYHSTLFHELTHSTGHSKRLARDGIAQGTFGAFGDAVYSAEELVAEMGAAILCAVAGIEQGAAFDASAAYLAHWLKALEADNRLIIQAAAQAQKAVDLITSTKFEDKEES
jgi:antirestriction protein ArdC